jgi:glucan 1,3-beta-glucosidase
METAIQPLRGVNLGGWLVLEKWMTPRLFEGTTAEDEYTFMQTPGAGQKIDQHRKTFITEADFAWLAKQGLNAVRVPVGYWLFGDAAPYVSAVEYLDFAVAMAKKYHLKVLICLHGAEGSQSGQHHTGKIGRAEWLKWPAYRERTVTLLAKIADRYRNEETVWGLELLNEPKIGLFQWKVRRFMYRAYAEIIKVARPGLYIVFHDGFTPRLMSGALIRQPDFPVVMDVHWYQFASLIEKFESLAGYFRRVARRPKLLRRLQRRQPVIVGEWSVVLSGIILRGRPKQREEEAFIRHGQLQLAAYQEALGWFYWTYKTEGRGIWHFRSLVEDGILSLDNRSKVV